MADNEPHHTQFCLHSPIGAQGSLLHCKLLYDERRGIAAVMTYFIISTELRRDHTTFKNKSPLKNHIAIDILKLKQDLEVKKHTNETLK